MMADGHPGRILLFEGKTDCLVVTQLCKASGIPENTLQMKYNDRSGTGGIDWVLEGIPVELKASGLLSLGIIVDADGECQSRWASIKARLTSSGYTKLPEQISADGFISTDAAKPLVGVWIMPNNHDPGALEDFVLSMVPKNDQLLMVVREHIGVVEARELNHYNQKTSTSKAVIHSWLACQREPGKPFGLAITAHYLDTSSDLPIRFMKWLRPLHEGSISQPCNSV